MCSTKVDGIFDLRNGACHTFTPLYSEKTHWKAGRVWASHKYRGHRVLREGLTDDMKKAEVK